jgi:hypothetical protein
LAVLLVWPISSLTHRHFDTVSGQRMLSVLCYLACLSVLAFMVQLAGLADNAYHLLLHGLRELPALLWLPVVFAGLVALQLVYGIRVWVEGFWWISRRLHFTLLLIAQCGLVWWFWYWNLMPIVVLEYLK